MEARAFVELLTYIETSIEEGVFFFKLSELRHLYENRLRDFAISKEVNKVRFKEQILSHFPQAQAQSDGKNIILVFEKGMQQMMKQAYNCNYEDDALILCKAAKIIREDIINSNGFQFDGSFPPNCQQNSVPINLKYLVSMLLNGSSIKDQESIESQSSLTISQAILFNCKRRSTKATSRHSKKFEPPLPLYIGLKVHTQTRSKSFISELYQLGLSVSYDRVLELENQIASSLCEHANEIGLVCPSQLSHGIFTVGALDNLDHNPSSTTAKDSFHGTGISLFQFPTELSTGSPQVVKLSTTSKCKQLPDSYTTVPAVVLKKENVTVPDINIAVSSSTASGQVQEAILSEHNWIEHAIKLIAQDEVVKGDSIAWAAYHASHCDLDTSCPAVTQLMPLFYEKAASIAMVKHGMSVQFKAIQFLNPGQIPVTVFDAPLFALAKLVQWKWQDVHGESKHVVMMGGLHIEMAMWNTFGDYLEGSGWVAALTEAGVASPGTVDSFLKAAHLTRTRYAHQVSSLALAQLQDEAYKSTDEVLSIQAWRESMSKNSPMFQYWDTILSLELLGHIFVRAHREKNFALYLDSLKEIVPWFFALDHYHYARWLPVHIRDMENLPTSIYNMFNECGHWVIPKTKNRFSAIPIDQAHEQNNAIVKGSGGAVGLTQNPAAFRKWLLAGPEQARLIQEFESQFLIEKEGKYLHHDEGLSTQKAFKLHVLSLVDAIKDMHGNPFLDQSEELLTLDTGDVADDSVVETVRSIEALGKEKFKNYFKSVLVDRTCSIHEPIKKNNLSLFKCPKAKSKTKQSKVIENLKNDVSLFSRLYIVAKNRDCDMPSFFKHENQPFPPSLSDHGKLRSSKKSDLLQLLPLDNQQEHPTSFDAMAIDGAALVHLLPTVNITTFDEYADTVFLPHLSKMLEKCDRLDVVWDTYIPDSIKASTREKRGKGIRRKVAGKNKVPTNWKGFLRDEKNKQELFEFLSTKIVAFDYAESKEVFVTKGQNVLTNKITLQMSSCDHEEADTRLIIHTIDALSKGRNTCLVRTVDTDIVVILVGKFFHFISLNSAADIWVAFGTGKNFTYLHINTISHNLGEEKCLALPFFHSFSGCDTTSAFFGKGKKAAWEAWKCFPEVSTAFTTIALDPFTHLDLASPIFTLLQRYTVVIYSKNSNVEFVDEARMESFCHGNKTMENIPPTADCLLQHARRAAYQASVWTTSEHPLQGRPTPESWGWTWNECDKKWAPVWITQPIANKACLELVKCGCQSKKGCGARCSCKKANWSCTELCKCNCLS